MNSPAFDDETIDLEYTAPGHDNALSMPIALVPVPEPVQTLAEYWQKECERLQSELELLRAVTCEHTFELQSMRNALEQLRSENDNLRAERDSIKMQLELCEERD